MTRSLALRVLSVTDLHGAVMAHDYFTDTVDPTQGLTRTASLIRAARAEKQNTVLLDSGDFLQGSPMGDVWVAAPERLGAAKMPVIEAMNTVGVEASTLGNHDFNYGLGFLRDCLAGAAFPVVCANVAAAPLGATPADDRPFLPPYSVLERSFRDDTGQETTLRLGVIGVCPAQIMAWDQRLLKGKVNARCPVEALAHWVPRLRAEGVDLVVALCHAGIEDRPLSERMEQVAVHVAAVPGIDVVLAGHQHMVFPGPRFAPSPHVDPVAGTLSGKPAVMAGYNGSHLGVIDLQLEQGPGGWRIARHKAEARPITGTGGVPLVVDDATLSARMRPAHEETRAYVARPVARASTLVTTYFVPVASSPALGVVAAAQAEFVRARMAGSAYDALPLISITAPFKAGGFGGPEYYSRIDPGPATMGDIIDLYLYPNGMTALCLSAAALRDWLDRAAGMFRHVPEGCADAPLLNPAFQTYNFDVAHGLHYAVDLGVPPLFDDQGNRRPGARSRIRDMTLDGAPMDEGQRVLVATNSFRAGGGGGYPIDGGGVRVGDWPISVRDVLMAHVRQRGVLGDEPPADWRFASQPGSSVLFPTSPLAGDDLPDLPTGRPERVGLRADGFAEYRIRL